MTPKDASVAALFYGLRRAAATLFSVSSPPPVPAGRATSPPTGLHLSPLRKRKNPCRLLPLLLAAWLAACSTPLEVPVQPAAAPTDPTVDQARLYFYRPDDSLFPAIRPEVIINGRKVGVSVVGEAFYRDARPGRYEIFLTSDDDDRLSVVLRPGEVRYVRTSIALGWLGPQLSPTEVDAGQGARDLENLRLVEPRLED